MKRLTTKQAEFLIKIENFLKSGKILTYYNVSKELESTTAITGYIISVLTKKGYLSHFPGTWADLKLTPKYYKIKGTKIFETETLSQKRSRAGEKGIEARRPRKAMGIASRDGKAAEETHRSLKTTAGAAAYRPTITVEVNLKPLALPLISIAISILVLAIAVVIGMK